MNQEQIQTFKDEIKDHLADTVKVTVNGKIDEIDRKIDLYIKEDTAWKVRAEPVVKAFENTNWLFKLFVSTLKFVALVGGAGGAYVAITKLLK